jgi:hypothetical protein
MRAFFRKRLGSFVPTDDRSARLLAALRNDDEVLLEVTQVKNARHVKLYFAMLDFARDHAINPETGEVLFITAEQAKKAMKIAAGAAVPFVDPATGRTYWEFESVREMDAAAFSDFFDRAVYVITHRWLPPGTTEDSVRRELFEMIEPRQAA